MDDETRSILRPGLVPSGEYSYRGRCPRDSRKLTLCLPEDYLACSQCGYRIKRETFEEAWRRFEDDYAAAVKETRIALAKKLLDDLITQGEPSQNKPG